MQAENSSSNRALEIRRDQLTRRPSPGYVARAVLTWPKWLVLYFQRF